MSNYDISDPVFTEQIRKLETTDEAHAEIFNELFQILLNNDLEMNGRIAEEMTAERAEEIYRKTVGHEVHQDAISDEDIVTDSDVQ